MNLEGFCHFSRCLAIKHFNVQAFANHCFQTKLYRVARQIVCAAEKGIHIKKLCFVKTLLRH